MKDLTVRRGGLAAALLLTCLMSTSGCGGGDASSGGSVPPPAPSSDARTSSGATATQQPSSAPARTEKAVPAENNPPGDIPDNLAFIPYSNKSGGYAFTHPEGWAQTLHGVRVRFTDKLNGVVVESLPSATAPTESSARANDVPRLRAAVPAFQLRSISPVTLPAGHGVKIVFRRNSDPDSVTGKVYRDEVEEYDVFSAGRLVRMDLYGPVGADNVDAYRTMSQSLKIR
jgi:hypothetical protein